MKKKDLQLVEKCEAFLHDMGLNGSRLRLEGGDAVLQMSQKSGQQLLLSGNMDELLRFVQLNGFTRVLLDLNWRN